MDKKLYRSKKDQIIGGVCGGIAEYFGIDSTLVRLAFVLFALIEGAGIIAYIIAWLIIPESPQSGQSKAEEEKKNKEQRKRILGLILVALGIFFILDNWIPGFYWRRFWPVILIVLGVVLIYREVRGK